MLLLLGVSLFCSVLVFVINFVLGFAVQLASGSTKLPSSVAYVGSQLVSPKTAIYYMSFFHLHRLLGYFGRHWFRLGFAEQLQAGTAKAHIRRYDRPPDI